MRKKIIGILVCMLLIATALPVVGITNRPDVLDNSLLRTGRLDLVQYVTPPDEKGRLEIIKILTEKMPLSSDVKLQEIAVATQNYSALPAQLLLYTGGSRTPGASVPVPEGPFGVHALSNDRFLVAARSGVADPTAADPSRWRRPGYRWRC